MDGREWPEDDSGLKELPPNTPPGFLGERPPDLRKVDTFEPDGVNAGLVQESTPETRWLTIVILYLVFFPAAAVVLWRSRYFSHRQKVVTTLIGAAGVIAVTIAVLTQA